MSVFISHDRLVNCLASVRERFKFAELCLWRLVPSGAEPVRFDPDHTPGEPGEVNERQTSLSADPRRLVGYQRQIEAGETFALDACDGGLLVVPSPPSPDVTPVALVASPSDHLTTEELVGLRSEVARLATLLALYDTGVAARDVSRELSGRLIVAQESERRRIAREVHDDLSQRAALLAIELERFAADSPPSRGEITKRSTEFAHSAAELATDLHRLSHRLHPAKLEALGLVAAIQGFCRELWAQHAFQVQFDHRDVPACVPTDVSLCLYRIVQEGLLNVLKHSGTRKAGVELIGQDQELLLRIADPGRGFEQTQRAAVGLGLSSMRERVRSLAGDFVVHTAPGHGTRIGVRVRVNPGENVREKQSA